MSITLVLVSCAFGTTALESDMDNLFVDMEYDNEFYVTQTESIRLYNEMLEAFAEKTSTTYSLNSQTAEETYPEYYGGAYIDDNGELVVLVTEMTSPVNSEVRQVTDYSSQVSTELCEVSYNEMCYVIDFLTSKINYLRNQGIIIASISDDILNGSVNVSIVELTTEKEDRVKALVNCDFLKFENSDYIQNDVSSIGGGYGIASDTGTSTVGFAAEDAYYGGSGIVVASHAFQEFGDTAYYNGEYVGFVWKTAYYDGSTADASYITHDGDVDFTAVLNNNGHIMSGSTIELPVNSTVSICGNVTLYSSGKVTSTNVTVNYSNTGITFTKQVAATYSSQAGDSGAPILFYDGLYGGKACYVLRGIHSGHNLSTGISFFTPYKNIVDELEIVCVTS